MIRCTCGNQLASLNDACERCLPGFGGNARPPLPMRASLQDEYRAKIVDIEDELLEWKEAAELANNENVELRAERDRLSEALRRCYFVGCSQVKEIVTKTFSSLPISKCECKIEMGTFRALGAHCPVCGGVIGKDS